MRERSSERIHAAGEGTSRINEQSLDKASEPIRSVSLNCVSLKCAQNTNSLFLALEVNISIQKVRQRDLLDPAIGDGK